MRLADRVFEADFPELRDFSGHKIFQHFSLSTFRVGASPGPGVR